VRRASSEAGHQVPFPTLEQQYRDHPLIGLVRRESRSSAEIEFFLAIEQSQDGHVLGLNQLRSGLD
jgi:hypothetical protein